MSAPFRKGCFLMLLKFVDLFALQLRKKMTKIDLITPIATNKTKTKNKEKKRFKYIKTKMG